MCICICAIIIIPLKSDKFINYIINKRLGTRINNIRASTPRNGVLRYYNPMSILKEKKFDEYQAEINTLITKACSLSEFG